MATAKRSKQQLRDLRDFCSEVSLLKHRAGELGLFLTMHKLDDAMKMVGYEVAGTPEKYHEAKKADLENEARYRKS